MTSDNESVGTPGTKPSAAPEPGAPDTPDSAIGPGAENPAAEHFTAESPAESPTEPPADPPREAAAAPATDPVAGEPPVPPVPPAAPAERGRTTDMGEAARSAPAAPPAPAVPPATPRGPAADQADYAASHPAGAWGNSTTHQGDGLPPGGPWSVFPPPPPPPKRRRGRAAVGIAMATLLVGGLGGYAGYLLAGDDNGSGVSASSANSDRVVSERAPESVAGIADEALPSVVTLQAEGDREGGTGTGFVYDEDGHIVTNNHVVASAADGGKLTATFSDGETFDAELVGGAQGYDIAVLRLLDTGDRELLPLPLGDSDDVAVGDTTIAIGAPFGLSGTVTTGIVSALNRPVASSDGMGSRPSYMSALQTDASINPGNSGGPLLDASGSVIGVNSAIHPNSNPGQQAGSIGLGFAIPVNQAQRVADDLINSGEPEYAVIGVTVDMRENTMGGAQIIAEDEGGNPAVAPGGPAADAGLRPGDVITKFGDRVIDSGPTLISEIWTYEPDETVELTYIRNGSEHTTSLTLDSRVGDQD